MKIRYACFWCCLLVQFTCRPSSSQQLRILLDDTKVVVTEIEIPAGKVYAAPEVESGDVWTVLDPLILHQMKGGQLPDKRVQLGDVAMIEPGERVEFEPTHGSPARLILVKPKSTRQTLTVHSLVLTSNLEDASARNETLLIAISNARFRDIRNLGDESEWKPGKSEIITMRPGDVRWVRSGIHHFTNLGSTPAKFISIEW